MRHPRFSGAHKLYLHRSNHPHLQLRAEEHESMHRRHAQEREDLNSAHLSARDVMAQRHSQEAETMANRQMADLGGPRPESTPSAAYSRMIREVTWLVSSLSSSTFWNQLRS
jgi:hypothetical protein